MKFVQRRVRNLLALLRSRSSRPRFPNLAAFARGNAELVRLARRFLPLAGSQYAINVIFRNLDHAIRHADYKDIAVLIDGLRPFLEPKEAVARRFWDALVADSARLSRQRLARGKVRSVWGVTPIATLDAGVLADRQIGIDAKSLVFNAYRVTSNFDFMLGRVQDEVIKKRPEDTYLLRWLVFIWALMEFDIFHLYNDRGIIEPAGGYGSPRFGIALAEMEIYRRAEKRLYTYCYGADHRTRQRTLALGRWTFCSECPDPGTYCVCDDEGGGRMLGTIRQFANAMVAHGLSAKIVAGARNVPYTCVDITALRPSKVRVGNNTFRIGHFPNHDYFKGTKYLEKAIEQLKGDGYQVEFVRLTGRSRLEILDAMRQIDVLVDQLVSGAFGLTAIEGMALGCPVICYLHDEVEVAELDRCPIIRANPETIASVLRNVIDTPSLLAAAREDGPKYVERNYSVNSLAGHLAWMYVDTAEFPKRLATRINQFAHHGASTGADEFA